ncbi:hypothetical protein E3E12_03320 [Formicincola oecophyllae]|uniref:Uncharacterized protein n=1 Tax=Formicincola oecophyllae TaxID=2558361 RepID=A0A4Y6U7K4_9PROT|nr:hypothetical protein [Formicincola oecophyllae]QDH13393.1 hypothetical protein E3E12_03320 [Formicincola oecophyllae]
MTPDSNQLESRQAAAARKLAAMPLDGVLSVALAALDPAIGTWMVNGAAMTEAAAWQGKLAQLLQPHAITATPSAMHLVQGTLSALPPDSVFAVLVEAINHAAMNQGPIAQEGQEKRELAEKATAILRSCQGAMDVVNASCACDDEYLPDDKS